MGLFKKITKAITSPVTTVNKALGTSGGKLGRMATKAEGMLNNEAMRPFYDLGLEKKPAPNAVVGPGGTTQEMVEQNPWRRQGLGINWGGFNRPQQRIPLMPLQNMLYMSPTNQRLEALKFGQFGANPTQSIQMMRQPMQAPTQPLPNIIRLGARPMMPQQTAPQQGQPVQQNQIPLSNIIGWGRNIRRF